MTKAVTKVLICPLNWGLGHATRCMPIIDYLLKAGYDVEIAGYGDSLKLLQNEYPSLKTHYLKGFDVEYSASRWLLPKLILQLPHFVFTIFSEYKQLKKLVLTVNPNVIISDNRYGLYHKNITSIIITHQTNPCMPKGLGFLSIIPRLIIKKLLLKFNQCWIPDVQGEMNLSGQLSRTGAKIKNAIFVGHLSRFGDVSISIQQIFKPLPTLCDEPKRGESDCLQKLLPIINQPYYLAIVSGPEPQRSLFYDILKKQLQSTNHLCLLVEGNYTKDFEIEQSNNLICVPHVDASGLDVLIRQSQLVICRSGYSSIMDLRVLSAKAILVPTPGQTEQLYLAKQLMSRKVFFSINQPNLNLNSQIDEAISFYGKTAQSAG